MRQSVVDAYRLCPLSRLSIYCAERPAGVQKSRVIADFWLLGMSSHHGRAEFDIVSRRC